MLQSKIHTWTDGWGSAPNAPLSIEKFLAMGVGLGKSGGRFKSVFSMVGEHCGCLRRCTERSAGGPTRAYVDPSSDNEGEKPSRRKPKVSCSQVNLLRVSRLLRRGREA